MPADVLITGATIRTSNPERPVASAMAVREGVIVAIGDEKDVLPWAGMGTSARAGWEDHHSGVHRCALPSTAHLS